MGFFDTVKNVASSGLDKLSKLNEEHEMYLSKYQNLSKEELLEKYKSRFASTAEKGAIVKIMKEKGWR